MKCRRSRYRRDYHHLFAYDPDGNRIARQTPDGWITFAADSNRPHSHVLEEQVEQGNTSVSYLHGNDLIASPPPPTDTSYYHCDGLGSTRLLTDVTETKTESYTYKVYGDLEHSTETSEIAYRYAGDKRKQCRLDFPLIFFNSSHQGVPQYYDRHRVSHRPIDASDNLRAGAYLGGVLLGSAMYNGRGQPAAKMWHKEIALEAMSIQQTLQAWSDETISLLSLHQNAGGALSEQIRTEVLEKNSLFREPATEDEIREVEARLNCALPPSYRSFLQCSNGWSLVDNCNTALMFSPASQVESFSEVAPDL